MKTPKTLAEIAALITNQVQESLHLDYKASRALSMKNRDEIAKDVSAFANSDGGVIVYGVVEEDHLPKGIDDGVPHQDMNREWLENILSSQIAPKIEGLEILQVPKSENSSLYVISVPKSYHGPHQAPSKQYFRRYTFSSRPMEHYEIQDVRNRRQAVSRLVLFDVEVDRGLLFVFVVSNRGSSPAEDVTFEFSHQLEWSSPEGPPHALKEGIRYLPPGRKLRFIYGQPHNIFNENHKGPRSFSVRVSYTHPELSSRHSEEFFFDFHDFLGTIGEAGSLEELDRRLRDGFREVGKAINAVANRLQKH